MPSTHGGHCPFPYAVIILPSIAIIRKRLEISETGKQYDEEFKKQAIKLAKEIGT